MVLAAVSTALPAEEARAPDNETVATVNGEAITIDDLFAQVGSMHMGIAEPIDGVKKPDPAGMLDRLIDVKMVVQEGRMIGLDELPEFTRRAERLRMDTLRGELARKAVAGVTEGDPKEVERVFREAVRELEVKSVLFAKEEDARDFVAALGAGGDYGKLAEAAITAGTAGGGGGARSMKVSDLRPDVARVLLAMKPGEISPPVRLGQGVTVIKLLGVRYPENAEEREMARQTAVQMKQQAILQKTMARWRDDYIEIDRELLDTLDYEAGAPQLDKLRSDERIVARVEGGEPVTVKELTAGVEKKFFHGVEKAGKTNKVKPELPGILDRILMERVAEVEAVLLGIEASGAFKDAMRRGEARILFEIFVQRVINPEVKLSEEELKRYYEEHTADYLSREMIRIESLAFGRREDAQAAIDKLRKGTDFSWMKENAAGRADRTSFEEMLELNGRVLLTDSLPQGIRAAVAGVRKDEYRFYDDPQGPAYVLLIREVIPAEASPYESVRTDISKIVYSRKRQAVIEEWMAKLRAASEIEIFATGQQLKERLGLGVAEGS
jgi:hypothetical protein